MGRTETTWQEAFEHTEPLAALKENIDCDVCIVGGGIAGISALYHLTNAGKRVVLIEKKMLRKTVTAHTTAFITSIIDTDLTDLEKMMGRNGVRQAIASGEDAIAAIERAIAEEHLECEFMRVPHYSIAYTDDGTKQFKEDEKLLLSLGYETKILQPSEFPFENKGSMQMPRQAKFHPLKYLFGLRAKAIERGAQCFEETEAIGIDGGEAGKGVQITTKSGNTIRAAQVIIATYNPFVQPWWYITKKGMYYSYIIECATPKGILPECIAEDDNNPYNYFRVDSAGEQDRLIIGGEDHRIELPLSKDNAWENLRRYADRLLGNTPYTVMRQWRGPILEQTDGLPLIGRYSSNFPNRFVATAFSGNGMTHGTTAGILLTDLILGKDNSYETLYRPNRPISGTDILVKGRDYLGEMAEGISRNLFPRKKK
jgi:glycine/D-amino acid oxidase-like deaminating enzyme